MLTLQEDRAIRLALPILDSLFGPRWSPPDGTTLSERYPMRPTPECIVTNGTMRAAIEVKRLVGDPAARKHWTSHMSLVRRLTPSYGGRYWVWPCAGFRLPMAQRLIRAVRQEIERVGKAIPPRGDGAIRIRRTGELRCISKDEGQFVNCWHAQPTDEVVRELSGYVRGTYYFADGDRTNGWCHSFITDDARREFQSKVIDACDRSDRGRPVVVEWEEEWKLTRWATSTKDGVFVPAMHFGWVEAALREELQEALDSAAPKFGQRWADVHVIILERIEPSWAVAHDVQRLLPTLRLPASVDLILLVDGDCVTNLSLDRVAAP